MNRIEKKFSDLRQAGQKALVTFVTAGDPSLSATKQIVLALEKGGADIIELGVPFSDPMADGPVIQKASERALARGTTLGKILSLVASVRKEGTQSPILLMGYYNPILSYGLKAFARDAARTGVDAALVVDLPPEESEELDGELKKFGISLIYLLAPTSDKDRIRAVCRRARGFVYFVSITGVTGARLKSEGEIRRKIGEIRKQTRLPIAVGFGISKPEQARAMAKLADGVVIGSALVKMIEEKSKSGRLAGQVEQFARRLKSALTT